MKKILAAIGAGVMTLGAASVAFAADIWPVASSSDAYNTTAVGLGVLFLVVITSVLAAWASLTGLGFGLRKIKRYVTGRHF